MLTIMFILAIASLLSTIVSMAGYCPLFVPVFLIAIYICLMQMPK